MNRLVNALKGTPGEAAEQQQPRCFEALAHRGHLEIGQRFPPLRCNQLRSGPPE